MANFTPYEKLSKKKKRALIAILLVVAVYFAVFAVCYGLGMSRFRAGDHAAAEKLLAFPAKSGSISAKAAFDIIDLYDNREEHGLSTVSNRLLSYTKEDYAKSVQQEAGRLLTLVGQEGFELGLRHYWIANYTQAAVDFGIAADGSVPEAMGWKLLCEGMVLCGKQQYGEAHNTITRAKYYAQTEELKTECENARETIAAQRAVWEEKFVESLKTREPYKGLEEKYVMQTYIALNYHCRVNEYAGTRKDHPEGIWYNSYRFYSGSDMVYYVSCTNGKVDFVSDKREEVKQQREAAAKKAAGSGSTKKKKSGSSDPFHASDFAHPEDFYDWYMDDFWDYEDAEDYWEAHH